MMKKTLQLYLWLEGQNSIYEILISGVRGLFAWNLNAKVEISTGLEVTSASCRSGSSPDLGGEGHVPTALTSKKPPATRGATGGFYSNS